MSDNQLEYFFLDPAAQWSDALPVGNGRMGAMIYGNPRVERIFLSDATFWSGEPSSENNNPDGPRIVAEVLIGLMQTDRDSWLRAQPQWRPTLPSRRGRGEFDMVDLLTLAGVDPRSRGQ